MKAAEVPVSVSVSAMHLRGDRIRFNESKTGIKQHSPLKQVIRNINKQI